MKTASMERIHVMPRTLRPHWQDEVRRQGLVYLDTLLVDDEATGNVPADGKVTGGVVEYWREGSYYQFNEAARLALETAADTLLGMYVEVGDYVIKHNLFAEMGIPAYAIPAIKRTWEDDLRDYHAPSVYGRFDIRYGPNPQLAAADPTLMVPKLLEYNADTPTSLVESAIIQYYWWEHYRDVGMGQWNNIHEALVQAWIDHIGVYEARTGRKVSVIYFSHTKAETSGEDMMNTSYIAHTAEEAAKQMGRSIQIKFLYQEEIQLLEHYEEDAPTYRPMQGITDFAPIGPSNRRVTHTDVIDAGGNEIHMIFKLYPWEWMVNEQGGEAFCQNLLRPNGTVWIEPIWRLLYSNKRSLVYLWRLFGNQPEGQYLLPAYDPDDKLPPGFLDNHVAKPNLGREGAGVTIVKDGKVLVQGSRDYGDSGYTLQGLAMLPNFRDPFAQEDNYAVTGVWTSGFGDNTRSVGMCLREGGPVTGNTSFFSPHVIID